jgi:catechol 2,3-dioxygenase-like lactoylglutathione lyase family enzyme
MKIAMFAAAAALGLAAGTAPAQTAPQVGFIGLGLNVADMERSMKFYVEGLGMKPLARNERTETVEQFLGYPATPYPPMLELLARKNPGDTPPPPARTSFKIVLSVDDAVAINEQLKRAGFSPAPVRMNPAAGGGSFFVRDPDGYNVEIVQRAPAQPKPAG